jgi:hypothetical protein
MRLVDLPDSFSRGDTISVSIVSSNLSGHRGRTGGEAAAAGDMIIPAVGKLIFERKER